jgi:BCD family chlorophyll transporter-like MFS transporter
LPSEKRFSEAVKGLLQSRHTRWFAAFLLVSMFSLFMQDVILEPFGGEVFELRPAETTRFNAYMGVGLIASMVVGGMILIPRRGKRWVTEVGCWAMAGAFAGLAASSFSLIGQGLPLIILMLGLGAGLFTVGGVALMMDLTSKEHTGLFIGAWTLVQALARGPASLFSGGLYNAITRWGASAGQSYGLIFALEAAGVVISIIFLRRVAVKGFQLEMVTLGVLASEAAD